MITCLVYLAGHGWSKADGPFYFMTRACGQESPEQHQPKRARFDRSAFGCPGKKIVLLESCHTAAAQKAKARSRPQHGRSREHVPRPGDRDIFRRSARVEYRAFRREMAQSWSFHGRADRWACAAGPRTKRATSQCILCATILKEHVSALTDNKQHPVSVQTNEDDFPLARITK